jgi:mono/diheme cytochrome c family protein
MVRRIALVLLAACCVIANAAWAQNPNAADDVQQGHRLAVIVCANCHVAARDQLFQPILQPPAPSFESIAQREGLTSEFIQTFLATTHRDITTPQGMPNPQLLDFQTRQMAAYLLSLRKQP